MMSTLDLDKLDNDSWDVYRYSHNPDAAYWAGICQDLIDVIRDMEAEYR